MAKIITVTVENFQTEVMKEAENRPVVLTFASSQMPECASYNAILEKLSSELDFTLGEVNLDEPDNMAFVQTFRLQSLPFVVVLHKGQMEDAIQGSLPEDELKKRLSKFFMSDEISPGQKFPSKPKSQRIRQKIISRFSSPSANFLWVTQKKPKPF